MREGVTRFRADHRHCALTGIGPYADELDTWRTRLAEQGLIGQDPERYDGVGFGNLSARLVGDTFLITGTQTGGLPRLSARDFARVDAAWPAENRVASSGQTRPSSESMTHAALYMACDAVGAVFHVHSPDIWTAPDSLGLATTPADVAYGTPEMAALVARNAATPSGALAMLGHEDGVVVWAPSMEEAGTRVLGLLSAARQWRA